MMCCDRYIAEILLATNPFKQIEGMYDDDVKCMYKGGDWTKLDPHVYATAEMAFMHMTNNAQSQSLLVAGESGAGKTETNKQLLDFLIFRAGVHAGTTNAGNLAQDIMHTTPVLEALGNAKTTRNNNSSRFGKYINLKFSSKYQIMGAEIRTFLLEKSRITSTSNAGERAYHIFYQVITGSQEGSGLECLKGMDPKEFWYLSQSDTQTTPAINDLKDFNEVHSALLSCGLSEEDRTIVYQIIGALLFLGNVPLEKDGDDACKLGAAAGEMLRHVDELLGISDLSKLLVIKVMVLPDGNKIDKPLTCDNAIKQRDALTKFIFEKLFDLLVAKMNAKIDADNTFHKFVGLLDVFGFEIFKVNSFEQLCINYANERLHNFFLMRVFEVEIELYRMQNLDVPPMSYPDNSKVIELLEKSPSGIFPCLDGQCRTPKATDDSFCQALHKAHGPNSKMANPQFDSLSKARLKGFKLKDDECFVIRHFAAPVCYTAAGFLEKNADELSPAFMERLKDSSIPLVKELMTDRAAETEQTRPSLCKSSVLSGARKASVLPVGRKASVMPGGRKKSVMPGRKQSMKKGPVPAGGGPKSSSVGKKFLGGLKQLMREIATTHPIFIRCIKPNNTLVPGDFNGAMILRQLQCSGTIECVKLMQAGYPSRAPYEDLRNRFKSCLPEFFDTLSDSKFSELLLVPSDCEPGDFQLGTDMVFFKGSKGSVLQDLMMMKKDDLAMAIRDGLQRKGRTSGEDGEHIVNLTAYINARKEAKRIAQGRIFGVVFGTMALLMMMERHTARIRAAVKVQASARGVHARRAYRQALSALKGPTPGFGSKSHSLAAKLEKARKLASKHLAIVAKAAAIALPPAAPKSLEEALAEAQEIARQETGGMTAEAHEHEAKWYWTLGPETGAKSGSRFHRFLMCKGIEFGFQYHNLYGDWQLQGDLINGRPRYVHSTMSGSTAHLFHCIDRHHDVPRWVVGPSPDSETGWAFCESDALIPSDVDTSWIAWDGFAWKTCRNFRFQTKEHELDGLSDEEELEDDEFSDEDFDDDETFLHIGDTTE